MRIPLTAAPSPELGSTPKYPDRADLPRNILTTAKHSVSTVLPLFSPQTLGGVWSSRWEHPSPTSPAVGNQDSPFWVSLVEQTSVEIWKLSRVDTVKLGVAPLTRKEEPERSFDSDAFRSEGRDRYVLASSSFLLSPCKAQHRSQLEFQGTGLAPSVPRGSAVTPQH